MAVLHRILITICMAVAVNSVRIARAEIESTKVISPRIEEPNKPPCLDYTVGKPIFHDNPGKLWICVAVSNAFELMCADGEGFNGDKCVPWDQYPCKAEEKPACEGPELTRPHQHQDPSKFWICKGVGEAVEYPCPNGSGFMDAPGDLGCVPWSRWRCVKKN